MKQGFDKLEVFRCSLNALTELYCNVPDAYNKGQAAAMLQRFSKAWLRDEDYVIMAIAQEAQIVADARLQYMVQQVIEKLQLPTTEEEFRENWKNLSEKAKINLVNSTISLLSEMKKEG